MNSLSVTEHKRALLLYDADAVLFSSGDKWLSAAAVRHIHSFRLVLKSHLRLSTQLLVCTNLIEEGVQHADTEHSACSER